MVKTLETNDKMVNQFDWYEKVKITHPLASVDGRFGAVVGMAQNDDGSWSKEP